MHNVAYAPMTTSQQVPLQSAYPVNFDGGNSELSGMLNLFPRSESMELHNDPRFMSNNVIAKRLVAFQTVSVVAVLMVNLAIKQMFLLEKKMDVHTTAGVIQYTGFTLMTCVFLMDLFVVIVVVQQLFMTYRLLTAGPTGFEIAKSYYLNPNIVTMRHMAVKGFLCSLPTFVMSSGCMVYVQFFKAGTGFLAIPTFFILVFFTIVLIFVNCKHASIFKERYVLAKEHEHPLLSHVEATTSRSRSGIGGSFAGVDV